MNDFWATLLAVLTGGGIATGGTLLAELLRDIRERRQAAKDVLRQNIYSIQDDLEMLHKSASNYVDSRFRHAPGDPLYVSNHNTLQLRIAMRAIRIDDQPLSLAIREHFLLLQKAMRTEDYKDAEDKLEFVINSFGPVQNRMTLLLQGKVEPKNE